MRFERRPSILKLLHEFGNATAHMIAGAQEDVEVAAPQRKPLPLFIAVVPAGNGCVRSTEYSYQHKYSPPNPKP